MKRVLFISPHFPPVNAPDMHRLRQILPYMRENGWEPVVFAIDPDKVEGSREELLVRTVPDDVEVFHAGAFSTRLTRLAGLGNLGIRSWFQLRNAVSAYLESNHVDLIFFSTTVFTAIAHGPYWKRRFNVPFVVDLQDPWRNDYYLTLPKHERPGKFWFDYWQKSRLEARTMPFASGVMAVSQQYIDTMHASYPDLENRPALTLPFGIQSKDIEIARELPAVVPRRAGKTTMRYIGRGGPDMAHALTILFRAVNSGLCRRPELFDKLAFEFIGTSYAANGKGHKSVLPVAEDEGVANLVIEIPDRLPYFSAMRHLLDADALVVVGSNDASYTASKVYPYVLANRPLLALFHQDSSAATFLQDTKAASVVTFEGTSIPTEIVEITSQHLEKLLSSLLAPNINKSAFIPFTAEAMTVQIVKFMNDTLAAEI